jgi:hypothetical protein
MREQPWWLDPEKPRGETFCRECERPYDDRCIEGCGRPFCSTCDGVCPFLDCDGHFAQINRPLPGREDGQ